jgi:5-formyltetrahydrofolate cyclo-ligase
MRSLRAALPPEERARLAALVEAGLLALPQTAAAHTVMVFSSFGSEVPTDGIVRRVLAAGHRVLLPYLDSAALEAAELQPGETPVPSAYGPAEPPSRVPVDPGEVDLVVVPGLAFDRQGNRVGYGGGHYDRYLARLDRDAVRVGIAFHLQLVEGVPNGPGDERVDLVITDRETIAVADRRRA